MYTDNQMLTIFENTLCAKNMDILLSREIFDDVDLVDKKEVATFFASKIEEIGLDKRIDNLRLYSLKNQSKYKMIKIQGNRKFFDQEIKTSTGAYYLLGFNHD